MRKILTASSVLVVGVVFLFAGLASAAVDATASAAATGAALTLKDTLVDVATTVLPYAAAILAIAFGWRIVRKFVHA